MIEDLIGRAITANTLRILPEIEQDFMELALKEVLEQYPIPTDYNDDRDAGQDYNVND